MLDTEVTYDLSVPRLCYGDIKSMCLIQRLLMSSLCPEPATKTFIQVNVIGRKMDTTFFFSHILYIEETFESHNLIVGIKVACRETV